MEAGPWGGTHPCSHNDLLLCSLSSLPCSSYFVCFLLIYLSATRCHRTYLSFSSYTLVYRVHAGRAAYYSNDPYFRFDLPLVRAMSQARTSRLQHITNLVVCRLHTISKRAWSNAASRAGLPIFQFFRGALVLIE